MWIESQDGNYVNSECVQHIKTSMDYSRNGEIANIVADMAGGGEIGLFSGEPDEAGLIMSQIGECLAAEKRFFKVVR